MNHPHNLDNSRDNFTVATIYWIKWYIFREIETVPHEENPNIVELNFKKHPVEARDRIGVRGVSTPLVLVRGKSGIRL